MSTFLIASIALAGCLFLNVRACPEAAEKLGQGEDGDIYVQTTTYGWPWAYYHENLIYHMNDEGKRIDNPDGPSWGHDRKSLAYDSGLALVAVLVLCGVWEWLLRRRSNPDPQPEPAA